MKNCTGLKEDSCLWRYMDFDNFLYTLVCNGMILKRPDKFDDPLEGFTGKKEGNPIGCAVKKVNVLCWHQSEVESEAMWRLYSSSFKHAIAIKTDIKTLCEVFPEQCLLEKVNYIDYKKDLPTEGREYLYKRKSFEHEKEVRVIMPTTNIREASEHFSVPLDYNAKKTLFKTIYISPYAPRHFNVMARALLNKLGFEDCKIIYSNDVYKAVRY